MLMGLLASKVSVTWMRTSMSPGARLVTLRRLCSTGYGRIENCCSAVACKLVESCKVKESTPFEPTKVDNHKRPIKQKFKSNILEKSVTKVRPQ